VQCRKRERRKCNSGDKLRGEHAWRRDQWRELPKNPRIQTGVKKEKCRKKDKRRSLESEFWKKKKGKEFSGDYRIMRTSKRIPISGVD